MLRLPTLSLRCARFLIICLTVGVLLLGSPRANRVSGQEPAAPADNRLLLAAAARSNVTPPLDMPLVGGWNSPPGKHVADELWARCLVLDNGHARLAFVIVDSLGVSREVFDAARTTIEEKTGIPPTHVMMAATHTHSSVSARGSNRLIPDEALTDYQAFLAQRISDGVRRAVNQLGPAQIGWGSAREPTSVFNRRYHMRPGAATPNPFGGQDRVVMNPGRANPDIVKAAGPTDPEVAFLAVRSLEGQPIAVLANYSLHYVGPGTSGVISADYFGEFADRLQQLLAADRLDPPFVGMMSNGTSADINNIDWLNKPDRRWEPFEKMRDVAQRVAEAVAGEYEQVVFHPEAELDAAWDELRLTVRKPTQQQLDRAERVLADPDHVPLSHQREATYARRLQQLAESPDQVSIPLQVVRVGDGAIAALPFEVFVEIGLQLKAESPLPHLFTISHANGTYGYLPTVQQHALGGYETWLGTNVVEVQAADKITQRLQAMLGELADGTAP